MSEFIATEYAELQSSGHPPDLQVHLYKEIGISALVAALHVMTKSLAPKDDATLDQHPVSIPAILQSDDLAA
jgi:hypothetical protein